MRLLERRLDKPDGGGAQSREQIQKLIQKLEARLNKLDAKPAEEIPAKPETKAD